MANYASKAKALGLVPKMGDVPAASLDWDQIRSWVSTYMDGKLRGFYTVPFSTTGTGDTEEANEPAIRQCAENLAAGLAQNLRYTEDDPGKMVDNFWWREGNNQLLQIRAGQIKLDRTKVTILDDEDSDQAKEDVDSTTMDVRPMFNEGTELDWDFGQVVNTTNDSPRKNLEDI